MLPEDVLIITGSRAGNDFPCARARRDQGFQGTLQDNSERTPKFPRWQKEIERYFAEVDACEGDKRPSALTLFFERVGDGLLPGQGTACFPGGSEGVVT